MMTCSGEETLVWRNTQAVYLRIGMLDGSRAYTRERFPEPVVEVSLGSDCDTLVTNRLCYAPNRVVVTSCCQYNHFISAFCHVWRIDGGKAGEVD